MLEPSDPSGVHLPPFELLRQAAEISSVRGELRVSLPYDAYLATIRSLLAAVPVDADWYLRTYPDVADAIAMGAVASAEAHFVDDGYFEGRLPGDPAFDEDYYLRRNPDVAELVRAGALPSARHHYVMDGYKEGRRPLP